MRRLQIAQRVTVSLDDVKEAIQCRVLEVQGSVGRLAPTGELPPRAVGRLALGTAGYLVFDALRAAVGLRVAVRASPPYLDVAVLDGVTLPERRQDERVKLVTPARIVRSGVGLGGAESSWTETLNLSRRGALLIPNPTLGGPREMTLELMFGDNPEPVTAQAHAVRRSKDGVAVRFESIGPADSARLNEYLIGARHQLISRVGG